MHTMGLDQVNVNFKFFQFQGSHNSKQLTSYVLKMAIFLS